MAGEISQPSQILPDLTTSSYVAVDYKQQEKLSAREHCGAVAIYSVDFLAQYYGTSGLMALQHRGTDAAGATSYVNGDLKPITGMGRIVDVLTPEALVTLGETYAVIAHTRYRTSGPLILENAQPVTFSNGEFKASLAHNGNLINAKELEDALHHPIAATSDTAIQTALLLQERPKYSSWNETLIHELPRSKGAFSSTMLTESGEIFAFRDNRGIRPLHLGRLKHGGWIVASESVALDAVQAEYMRPVAPGEIIRIDKDGKLSSSFFGEAARKAACMLEPIYFSRPDSLSDESVRYGDGRQESGRRLAERMQAKGIQPDIVVPVLNSGFPAGEGVADAYDMKTTIAITTNPNYAGRTFILPGQEQRIEGVNGKHNVVPDNLSGNTVVIVDDSVVRKTTMTGLNIKVNDADPKSTHAALASPPVVDVCDLGVDMPTKEELGAAPFADKPLLEIEEEMAKAIGMDSVTYLPAEDVAASFQTDLSGMCYHCFGGQHPITGEQMAFRQKERPLSGKPKIAILISNGGTNMQHIAEEVLAGQLDGEIVSVISNNPTAYGLERATHLGLPTTVISSVGRMKDGDARAAFEQEVASHIQAVDADIVVLAGWNKVLGNEFLQQMQQREVPVINVHPALLSQTNSGEVRTSRGKIPVVRGLHAIEKAYEANLPVSGVTVHQVLPETAYDVGPIILNEEVRRRKGESLENWETRIHEAEYRTLPTALKRLIHIMQQGIDVSHGDFPW